MAKIAYQANGRTFLCNIDAYISQRDYGKSRTDNAVLLARKKAHDKRRLKMEVLSEK